MRVVHCQKETYDVLIDRTTKWGNPYTHIKDKKTLATYIVDSREEAIEKYKEYVLANEELYDSLDELDGKVLGCWCIKDISFPIPYICHGQILMELLTTKKIKNLLNK